MTENVWRLVTALTSAAIFGIVIWGINLDGDVQLLQHQISDIPPRWLTERVADQFRDHNSDIDAIQEELKRLQRQIDRLESAHDGIESQVLPPYSYNYPDLKIVPNTGGTPG